MRRRGRFTFAGFAAAVLGAAAIGALSGAGHGPVGTTAARRPVGNTASPDSLWAASADDLSAASHWAVGTTAAHWPVAIGASSAHEVYVARLSDGSRTGSGNVVRLAEDGTRRGSWATDGPMKDLAVGADDAVYTVMDKSNRVYRFLPDGTVDGMWQAGSNVMRVAAGAPTGRDHGSVYVLWRPQPIGEPPSGPPRVTRYDADGELLAEWEVGERAYDLTIANRGEGELGLVFVADGGGQVVTYGPGGVAVGSRGTVAGEGRPIAASNDGTVFVAYQPATDEAAVIWRYDAFGAAQLECNLPSAAPRDLAVDVGRGDIYVLLPELVLRLSPECAELGRFSPQGHDGDQPGARPLHLPAALSSAGLSGEQPPTSEPTSTAPVTATPQSSASAPATATGQPTPTGHAPSTGTPTPTAGIAPPTATGRVTATPKPTATGYTPATVTPTSTAGVEPPAVLLAAGAVSSPDVAGDAAFGPCKHLVVWRDTSTADGAIWGRSIGAGELGDTFRVSGDAGAAGPPAIAFSAILERWLVVWAAPDEQRVSKVRGRLVSCSGPEGDVIEIGRYWLIEDQPAVADDGDGFAVVWRRSFSGRPDLQLVGVRVRSATVPEPDMLGDPGWVSEPALACDDSGACLVAWTDGAELRERDVLARWWTPRTGTVDAAVARVAASDVPEFAASVAWNGAPGVSAFALTWSMESRYRAVLARSVRQSSAGLPVEVAMGLGGSFTPDIGPLGTGFVSAYALDPRFSEMADVYAARLAYAADTGALSRSGQVTLSDGALPSWAPKVAPVSGSEVLVVWEDRISQYLGQIVARYATVAESAPSP